MSWKKTQIIVLNVKKLQNPVVGRHFHNETKPRETFHCAFFAHKSIITVVRFILILHSSHRGDNFDQKFYEKRKVNVEIHNFFHNSQIVTRWSLIVTSVTTVHGSIIQSRDRSLHISYHCVRGTKTSKPRIQQAKQDTSIVD